MRPEVNAKPFERLFCLHTNFTAANLEILDRFQKLFFFLHGDLTAATLQTIVNSIAHAQMRAFNYCKFN